MLAAWSIGVSLHPSPIATTVSIPFKQLSFINLTTFSFYEGLDLLTMTPLQCVITYSKIFLSSSFSVINCKEVPSIIKLVSAYSYYDNSKIRECLYDSLYPLILSYSSSTLIESFESLRVLLLLVNIDWLFRTKRLWLIFWLTSINYPSIPSKEWSVTLNIYYFLFKIPALKPIFSAVSILSPVIIHTFISAS